MKKTIFIILLSVSTSSYAVPPNIAECLKKENGRCVSINEHIINSTIDILSKVPQEMGKILFKENNSKDLPDVPLKGIKSLSECMKGKNTIDNEVIHCRNGF